MTLNILHKFMPLAMFLAFHLVPSKIVRKNKPMQFTGFLVDLIGKCVEWMKMNWVSYLNKQLQQYCREERDQGYEFHFSWLLILIAFIAWEMPEGATFPKIDPYEPLALKFTML